VWLEGPLGKCRHMLHLSVVQNLELGDALFVVLHDCGGVHFAGNVDKPVQVDSKQNL